MSNTNRYPKSPIIGVEVSQEIIDQSVTRSSSHCMVAEAVKLAYPKAARVSVDVQTIRFTDQERGLRYVYLTPRIAQIPIIQFDQGEKPIPFSFKLKKGSVHPAGNRASDKIRPLTPAELARNKKMQEISHAKIVVRDRSAKLAPEIVGGSPPPNQMITDKDGKRVPLSRRRAFGLRALGY